MKTIKVLHGGTLGDAFSAFCRADALHKQYGVEFEWTRVSNPMYDYFDKPIASFFSLIPFVDFKGSRTDVIDLYEHKENRYDLLKAGYDVIMLTPLGPGFKGHFPNYEGPNCFPEIKTPCITTEANPVVIQVQGGKYKEPHGEMRGFSTKSLEDMCAYLFNEDYSVYLIGKHNHWFHKMEDFDGFAELWEDRVFNKVGRTTLVECMSLIQQAKYFIGFDGFFTFFAPSQRVPTMQFSHLEHNGRMSYEPEDDGCGCWFDYTRMIRPIPCGGTISFDIEDFINMFEGLKEIIDERGNQPNSCES